MTKDFVIVATLIAFGSLFAYWPKAEAHSGATGMVRHRMELMKSLGASMKSLAAMFRGRVAYDPKRVWIVSSQIRARAEKIPAMFPEGSDKHPSEAKATIWSDWSGFERAASTLGKHAALLGMEASERTAAQRTFRQLASSCKGCHQDYREKKN